MKKATDFLPLALLIALFGFAGCSPDPGGDDAPALAVYVCGDAASADGTSVPSLWRNGARSDLSRLSVARDGYATSLIASGGSVYAAGATCDGTSGIRAPCYWKDGARVDLPNSDPNGATCTDIAAADGHLYLSFGRGSGGTGFYRDGIEKILNSGTNEAGLGIAVADGEVFVAAYSNNGTYYHIYPICYSWDGTTQVSSGPASGAEGTAADVLVANGSVYVAATQGNLPYYWKDFADTALPLPEDAVAGSTTALTHDGSTLYVAGYTADSGGVETPCYWSVDADGDASCVQLPVLDATKNGRAQGIYVYAGVVYACGHTTDASSLSLPCYWAGQERSDLARISVDEDGDAKSIFVTVE
jgi:hypothetical protein